MPTEVIEDFTGGLNKLFHPTKIGQNQLQVLENMEVRPTNLGGFLTYNALTARSSYTRLHTDVLPFIPKNLIEFTQRVAGGNGNGTKYLVTGGTNPSSGLLELRYLKDGASTTVPISGAVPVTLGSFVSRSVALLPNEDSFSLLSSVVGVFSFDGGTTFESVCAATPVEDSDTIQVRTSMAAFPELPDDSTTQTGILVFMLFGLSLYYTDGTVQWRKWDGVTDAASGFTKITRTGVLHKNRAWYGNDVTSNVINRIWYSDVGLPEQVGASSFYSVGDQNEPIISISDQIERIIVVKQNSTWAIYMNPDPTLTTILRADDYRGSVSPRGIVWSDGVTYIVTGDSGLQMMRALQYERTGLQIYNFLKGFQQPLAALGYYQDQLWFSTLSDSTQVRNNRVFLWDNTENKMFQYNNTFSIFCQNKGVQTFNHHLKATEDDGVNRYIIEVDALTSVAESSLLCRARTKELILGQPEKIKALQHVILEAVYPDTTTPLTMLVYADGVLASTHTFTPSTTGFVRYKFPLLSHVNFAHYISFQFEYEQNSTLSTKFALLMLTINYDVEDRDD